MFTICLLLSYIQMFFFFAAIASYFGERRVRITTEKIIWATNKKLDKEDKKQTRKKYTFCLQPRETSRLRCKHEVRIR